MKQEDADKLKKAIKRGYSDRKDYPPYAMSPWDDRIRFQAWVMKIIDDEVKS